jgi:hypothetical protein
MTGERHVTKITSSIEIHVPCSPQGLLRKQPPVHIQYLHIRKIHENARLRVHTLCTETTLFFAFLEQ